MGQNKDKSIIYNTIPIKNKKSIALFNMYWSRRNQMESKWSILFCSEAVKYSIDLISFTRKWRSMDEGGALRFQNLAIRHLAAVNITRNNYETLHPSLQGGTFSK